MVINTAMALVIVAICLAVIATASTPDAQAQRSTVTVKHVPIISPGDVTESLSPQENIMDRKQYELLLRIYG